MTGRMSRAAASSPPVKCKAIRFSGERPALRRYSSALLGMSKKPRKPVVQIPSFRIACEEKIPDGLGGSNG